MDRWENNSFSKLKIKSKALYIHPGTPSVSTDKSRVYLCVPKIFPSAQLMITFIVISEISLKTLLQ